MSDGPTPSVEEFVEYCRTQAGLLSGSVETMSEEADDLLEEIDEGLDEARTRLEDRSAGTERTETPTTGGAADDSPDAMERVVRFEADRDAPAYFDRRTVLKAAASRDPNGG
jgi:hypothetical protein